MIIIGNTMYNSPMLAAAGVGLATGVLGSFLIGLITTRNEQKKALETILCCAVDFQQMCVWLSKINDSRTFVQQNEKRVIDFSFGFLRQRRLAFVQQNEKRIIDNYRMLCKDRDRLQIAYGVLEAGYLCLKKEERDFIYYEIYRPICDVMRISRHFTQYDFTAEVGNHEVYISKIIATQELIFDEDGKNILSERLKKNLHRLNEIVKRF